jgi:hypothetical protein
MPLCGTTMKHLLAIAWLVSSAYAFVPQTTIAKNGASRRFAVTSRDDDSTGPALISRQDFVTFASTMAVSSSAAVLGLTMQPNVAQARGRATFEVAYRKFTPRIVAGGEFYSTDMKKMIAARRKQLLPTSPIGRKTHFTLFSFEGVSDILMSVNPVLAELEVVHRSHGADRWLQRVLNAARVNAK